MQADSVARAGQFVRVAEQDRQHLRFMLDGEEVIGLAGDTVLIAILAYRPAVRRSDFSAMPRAGFCLMGACQDCWIWNEEGRRIRACTTPLQAGMRLLTAPPSIPIAHD